MSASMPGGVICPLATPLTDDEDLDIAALESLIDRVVPDLDGILALGSSGEFALLRPQVAERVVDVIIERVSGRVPVYLGVGDTGTAPRGGGKNTPRGGPPLDERGGVF